MLSLLMVLPERFGVLIVGHGTVATLEEIPGFLLAIRRGRPPSAALVSEIRRRYEAIGGSPLLKSTREQATALGAMLERPVYVGMRFCQPTIEDALRQAHSEQVTHLVVLPLAPYSVELYTAEVRSRLGAMTPELTSVMDLLTVEPWGNHSELVQAHADNIRNHAGTALDNGARLMLTAHSLPLRVIAAGDDYAESTASSARGIGKALGVEYSLCYQSEGADGGDWLGPSISEGLRRVVDAGTTRLVVAPFGFLCDHVETLYDLDIEFEKEAHSLGVSVQRVPALGTHPGLIRALSSLVMASWSRREKQQNLTPEGTSQ